MRELETLTVGRCALPVGFIITSALGQEGSCVKGTKAQDERVLGQGKSPVSQFIFRSRFQQSLNLLPPPALSHCESFSVTYHYRTHCHATSNNKHFLFSRFSSSARRFSWSHLVFLSGCCYLVAQLGWRVETALLPWLRTLTHFQSSVFCLFVCFFVSQGSKSKNRSWRAFWGQGAGAPIISAMFYGKPGIGQARSKAWGNGLPFLQGGLHSKITRHFI